MAKKFTYADWERFAESQICEICGSAAASITKHDQRASKHLCEKHVHCKPIIICCDCGQPFELKIEYWIHRWRSGNFDDWRCQTCHRRRNAESYRGSDSQKEHLKKLNPGQILKNWYSNPDNKEAISQARAKRYENHPELKELSAEIGRRNIHKTFLSTESIAGLIERNKTIMPDKRWGREVVSPTGCIWREKVLWDRWGLTEEDVEGTPPPGEYCPECGDLIPVENGRLTGRWCSEACAKAARAKAYEKSAETRWGKLYFL